MGKFKGIIALDIDGTITVSKHALEPEVSRYLNQLISEGWRIIFITGRTYSFAKPILVDIEGDFFVAVQNGAALYEMPQERCVKKNEISTELLGRLEPLFQSEGRGLLVESGKENGDVCYYKWSDFSSEELKYINFRIEISPEEWVAVDSFEALPIQTFAVGKFFAPEALALSLAEKILKMFPLSVIVIRDPFRPGFHLAHVSGAHTSKGTILQDFISMHAEGLPIIAAGDDYNDVEMLEKGTVKIVMANGPAKLQLLADIVAPPVQNQGIIQGLKEAIWKVSSG